MRLLLLTAALALTIGIAVQRSAIEVPERWNPWAPLHIEQAPNFLTRFKLMRLSRDDALCRQVLATAELRYQYLPDRITGPGCGFRNAVRIEATSAAVGTPFSLSCQAAVSLALSEKHTLQPPARAHFGAPVARVEHYGSYACRNAYGSATGRRSRHATADALDVAGFVLADGRHIHVQRDWPKENKRARFLREIHRGACRFFDTVLGPDSNSAHHDHFHFDRGLFGVRR